MFEALTTAATSVRLRTFVVSGIHCAGCESNIEVGLRRLDGVRPVKASHEDERITVRYDERRFHDDELVRQVIGSQIGGDGRRCVRPRTPWLRCRWPPGPTPASGCGIGAPASSRLEEAASMAGGRRAGTGRFREGTSQTPVDQPGQRVTLVGDRRQRLTKPALAGVRQGIDPPWRPPLGAGPPGSDEPLLLERP